MTSLRPLLVETALFAYHDGYVDSTHWIDRRRANGHRPGTRFVRAGLRGRQELLAADPVPEARERFAKATGGRTTAKNGELIGQSDVIFLAVKPQQLAASWPNCRGNLAGTVGRLHRRRRPAGPLASGWPPSAAGPRDAQHALPGGAGAWPIASASGLPRRTANSSASCCRRSASPLPWRRNCWTR